jgi:hypothetical protein
MQVDSTAVSGVFRFPNFFVERLSKNSDISVFHKQLKQSEFLYRQIDLLSVLRSYYRMCLKIDRRPKYLDRFRDLTAAPENSFNPRL